MGSSCVPGTCGVDPWAASPKTGGPLGTNKDAGDAGTPAWFVGDTPGTLGHNDHADVKGGMCHGNVPRTLIENYVEEMQKRKKAIREQVKAELKEAYLIRDGFGDRELLKKADEEGWSDGEFDAAVKEKLFGKPKDAGNENYVSPMGTNRLSCEVKENWNKAAYVRKGFPEIIYQADRAHEDVHSKSCQRIGKGGDYAAAMSFPKKFSADEVKAYQAKIDVLEKWLAENP